MRPCLKSENAMREIMLRWPITLSLPIDAK
jgi:hypothetical protein